MTNQDTLTIVAAGGGLYRIRVRHTICCLRHSATASPNCAQHPQPRPRQRIRRTTDRTGDAIQAIGCGEDRVRAQCAAGKRR
jgi:hypothetical protein